MISTPTYCGRVVCLSSNHFVLTPFPAPKRECWNAGDFGSSAMKTKTTGDEELAVSLLNQCQPLLAVAAATFQSPVHLFERPQRAAPHRCLPCLGRASAHRAERYCSRRLRRRSFAIPALFVARPDSKPLELSQRACLTSGDQSPGDGPRKA